MTVIHNEIFYINGVSYVMIYLTNVEKYILIWKQLKDESQKLKIDKNLLLDDFVINVICEYAFYIHGKKQFQYNNYIEIVYGLIDYDDKIKLMLYNKNPLKRIKMCFELLRTFQNTDILDKIVEPIILFTH